MILPRVPVPLAVSRRTPLFSANLLARVEARIVSVLTTDSNAPFSDELKKMLQEGMEKVDLEHFIRLNKIEETKDKPKEDT